MVNFHGATIPRGWQRTYPNLVSVEAVNVQAAANIHTYGILNSDVLVVAENSLPVIESTLNK